MLNSNIVYLISLTHDNSYSRTVTPSHKLDTVLNNSAGKNTPTGLDITFSEIAKAYSHAHNIHGQDVLLSQTARAYSHALAFSKPDPVLTCNFNNVLAQAVEKFNSSCA